MADEQELQLMKLATKQNGMVTKDQATEIMGADTALDDLCGPGPFAWITDRVAVLKKTQRSSARSSYAAYLHDPNGAISHQTALALWLDESPSGMTDYSVVWDIKDESPNSKWFTIHQVDSLEASDIRMFRSARSFRITSPERTILDCALDMEYSHIGSAICRMVEAGTLTQKSFDQVESDLILRGNYGREIVDYVHARQNADQQRAQNTESRILHFLTEGNFPEHVRNYRMALGKNQFEVIDIAWPKHGIGIDLTEPQSCDPHVSKAERVRLKKLAKAGMHLITFDANPYNDPEEEMIEALARHLNIDWSPPHEHDEYCECGDDDNEQSATTKPPKERLASITVLGPSGASLN